MKIKGTYTQPVGNNLAITQKYYAKRYNLNFGHYSQRRLGLQILVLFLGTYLWINVEPHWLKNN